jgi:hypothetical protein
MSRVAFGFLLIAAFSFWVGLRSEAMGRVEACREAGGRWEKVMQACDQPRPWD